MTAQNKTTQTTDLVESIQCPRLTTVYRVSQYNIGDPFRYATTVAYANSLVQAASIAQRLSPDYLILWERSVIDEIDPLLSTNERGEILVGVAQLPSETKVNFAISQIEVATYATDNKYLVVYEVTSENWYTDIGIKSKTGMFHGAFGLDSQSKYCALDYVNLRERAHGKEETEIEWTQLTHGVTESNQVEFKTSFDTEVSREGEKQLVHVEYTGYMQMRAQVWPVA